jgi:hypothetical protein
MRKLVIVTSQILCVYALVLTIFCPSTSSQTAKTNSGPVALQLTIQADKIRYLQGSNIPIHARLTNVGQRAVIVGRDMWTNASPSRVRLSITPVDGHKIGGTAGAVDGAPDFEDVPKAVLNWCISLPPGYSYESDTMMQSFVDGAGLTPGLYRVRAVFESSGIRADTYFNPLLGNTKELEALRDQDWKGVVGSNEMTFTIVAAKRK